MRGQQGCLHSELSCLWSAECPACNELSSGASLTTATCAHASSSKLATSSALVGGNHRQNLLVWLPSY